MNAAVYGLGLRDSAGRPVVCPQAGGARRSRGREQGPACPRPCPGKPGLRSSCPRAGLNGNERHLNALAAFRQLWQ